MSGSCCGGCGGQDSEPKDVKAGEKEQATEQEPKQAQKQEKE